MIYNKTDRKKNVLRYDIDLSKFWSRINIAGDDECWLWAGAKNTGDYGLFTVRSLPEDYEITGRTFTQVLAHRVMYGLHNDDLKEDLYVCHSCDTPACCNPAHLWIGTHQENMDDMTRKQRKQKLADHRKRNTPSIVSILNERK